MNNSDKIEFESHKAEGDTSSIHRAVRKASENKDFIIKTVEQLESMKFPAYKYQILDYAAKNSLDKDAMSLLQSLDDKMLYHSKFSLKKALERENTDLKKRNQISDETRKNLAVQNIDRRQRRHDYPETPATAMKNYICDFCGKEFQSRDQLLYHQEFEYKDKDNINSVTK